MNFGSMQMQGILHYGAYNPMNKENIGSVGAANIGIHYRPGAQSIMWSFELRGERESYSASEVVQLQSADARKITSTITTYMITLGGSWR
jgi:hypothetical protein